MPQLGRFDRFVQDGSGNAISGQSVTIYREGATCNGAQSGTSPFSISVRHRGKIVAADTVFVDTVTGTTYAVDSTTATTVVVSGFAGTLAVTDGQRIIPSNNKPTLYSDDQSGATTANPLTSSSTGRAQCFMEFGSYDVVVSGSGVTTTALTAQVTPSETPAQVRYAEGFPGANAGAKIANAIADLPTTGGTVDARGLDGAQTFTSNPFGSAPNGTVVLLGAGTYTTTAQLVIPARTRIVGIGKRHTVLKADSTFAVSTPVVRLGPGGTGRLFDMRLENLNVDCNDVAGSVGVYSTQVNEGSGLFNCVVNKYRSIGVDLLTSGGDTAGTFEMDCCELFGSASGSTSGVRLNTLDVGFTFIHGTINTNDAAAPGTDAFDLTSCHVFIADAHIEKHADGIDFKGGSSGVVCNVYGHSTVTNLVHLSSPGGGVALFGIAPNSATNSILDDVTSRTITTSTSTGMYILGSEGVGATRPCISTSNLSGGYWQLANAVSYRAFTTFANLDTTPSVALGNWFKVSNSLATSVTQLADAYNGQLVVLEFTNGDTTMKDASAGGNFHLSGSADYTPAASATLTLINGGAGAAWFEVSRSNN